MSRRMLFVPHVSSCRLLLVASMLVGDFVNVIPVYALSTLTRTTPTSRFARRTTTISSSLRQPQQQQQQHAASIRQLSFRTSYATTTTTTTQLHAAKRNRKQASKQDEDDLYRWYDSVDADASPDDVFWEEMERQRLLNEIGEGSGGGSLVDNLGGGVSGQVSSGTTSTVSINPNGSMKFSGGGGGASSSISSSSSSSNPTGSGPVWASASTSLPSTNSAAGGGVGGGGGGAAGGGGGAASGIPPGSVFTMPTPTSDQLRSAEATLVEYEMYMTPDNWLNEELVAQAPLKFDGDEEFNALTLQEQKIIIEEEMKSTENGKLFSMENDEPWDFWGEREDDPAVQTSDAIRMDPQKVSEFFLSVDDEPDEEQRLKEKQRLDEEFWERMADAQIHSRRLERAKRSEKAKDFFSRKPDEREGYDRMWVSAVDNVCFKSLVGNFRNYGVEFADNFGDWQDGCPEDGLYSIEDVACYKARLVHQVTGLPCIASRTSFEIEPIPPSSLSSSSSSSSSPNSPGGASPAVRTLAVAHSNPRVVSGYKINDIGMNVEYLCEALRPLSEPTRVTRFHTCLCYYDGEMEVYDYGVCDVDIHFATSMRTFISVAMAINAMVKTMQITHGLEFQGFLKAMREQALAGYGGGGIGKASVKLRDRVLKDAKVLPNDIIDVSKFMDSQIDVNLMDECAQELSNRFVDYKPTKILTVATTGLVIALPMAKYLQVPVVYARKERNIVMADTYKAAYSSKTVGRDRQLFVSKSHIRDTDRILVIDDFLSGGSSQEAMLRIVSDAGATAVGVGVLLEKVYDSGRRSLSGFNLPVHSLCRVASVKDGVIQLVEEEGYIQS